MSVISISLFINSQFCGKLAFKEILKTCILKNTMSLNEKQISNLDFRMYVPNDKVRSKGTYYKLLVVLSLEVDFCNVT